ncbi:MAG: hypothetical protein LBG59_08025 [Candidatus Peribacteria bacterium]|nr:hypothetical protein [Candidatus Peribacteria bacterium]
MRPTPTADTQATILQDVGTSKPLQDVTLSVDNKKNDPYKEQISWIAEVYQIDQQKKLTCTIKGEQFTLEAVMYAFAHNETSSLKP